MTTIVSQNWSSLLRLSEKKVENINVSGAKNVTIHLMYEVLE